MTRTVNHPVARRVEATSLCSLPLYGIVELRVVYSSCHKSLVFNLPYLSLLHQRVAGMILLCWLLSGLTGFVPVFTGIYSSSEHLDLIRS